MYFSVWESESEVKQRERLLLARHLEFILESNLDSDGSERVGPLSELGYILESFFFPLETGASDLISEVLIAQIHT